MTDGETEEFNNSAQPLFEQDKDTEIELQKAIERHPSAHDTRTGTLIGQSIIDLQTDIVHPSEKE